MTFYERCVTKRCEWNIANADVPEAVVLLEPANDFHSLDARLQQTFLFGKLLEVLGRFPCL
jgi:hypothetical protein